jgi:predicted O-methyltransferase YrrM
LAAFIARGDKSDRAYAPSFESEDALLSHRQAEIHDEVASVDGWLEPEDSMKLYELAYLAPGPFLEIGTYRGKSTTVLTSALRDAARQVEFYSLDIAPESLESARATLATRGLGRHVTLVNGSVTALFRALPAFRPRFVFLDGDHSAAGLGRDLATLEGRVPTGALLLFHDFLDNRNDDPANTDYGVPEAIRESWVARDCEFAGAFGCAGLFHRIRGPRNEESDGDGPPIIELIGLDRLRVRLLIKGARPAKRYVLRVLGRPRQFK